MPLLATFKRDFKGLEPHPCENNQHFCCWRRGVSDLTLFVFDTGEESLLPWRRVNPQWQMLSVCQERHLVFYVHMQRYKNPDTCWVQVWMQIKAQKGSFWDTAHNHHSLHLHTDMCNTKNKHISKDTRATTVIYTQSCIYWRCVARWISALVFGYM